MIRSFSILVFLLSIGNFASAGDRYNYLCSTFCTYSDSSGLDIVSSISFMVQSDKNKFSEAREQCSENAVKAGGTAASAKLVFQATNKDGEDIVLIDLSKREEHKIHCFKL